MNTSLSIYGTVFIALGIIFVLQLRRYTFPEGVLWALAGSFFVGAGLALNVASFVLSLAG